MSGAATFPSIPGFESLARLGGGGMGTVYLAREQGLYGFEKLWAVKLIRPNMEELAEFRAMFMDEAQLMARIPHPTIPQIHRFGEAESALYMVMEYVPGESFASLLAGVVSTLPPLIACSLIAKVCRGLHAAHELTDDSGQPMNVVHRDVTPSNLVLTYEGGVKILDFGIALMRERRAPVTGAGVIKGKPSYVAPEQFYAKRIDRRADVFSVSIVLWELLTGKKMIDTGELMRSGFDRTLEAAICAPSSIVGELPRGLDEIVLKGLAKEPEQRFESARDVARELEAIVERDGCETLEEYAERELRDLREMHEERIRRLRAGLPAEAAVWQPPPITQVESDPGASNTQPTSPDHRHDASRTFVLPRPVRARWRIPIALAFAALTATIALALFSSPGEPPAVAQPQITEARPIAVEPPPPAPAPPPPPPAEVIAPKPRTKQRVRRPPKIRVSAPTKEPVPQTKPKKGLISEW